MIRELLLAGKAHSPSGDALGANDRSDPEWGRARPGRYKVGGAVQASKAYAGGRDGIDHFYTAANVYVERARKARMHFHRADGSLVRLHRAASDPNTTQPEGPTVPDDLYQLLTWPNPWMHWNEFFALVIIDLLSVGNFFAVKNGADADGNKPAALYRLPAAQMEVESTKNRHIAKYVYTGGKKPVKFDPQQVMHLRLPNPHSPYAMVGTGAVQAAPQPFDIELGLVEAQRNWFAEGTVLSGVLESDRVIPDATRRRTTNEFLNLHTGSSQWGKIAFLERGMRYRPLQADAQAAGYEPLSKQSRERIFAMLHVPLLLAGIGVDAAPKGALDDARRYFAEDVMTPFLDALAPILTQQITQGWGLFTEFDYQYVPPQDQRVINAEKLATVPGMKVKEIREAAGYPPLGPKYKAPDGTTLIDDMVVPPAAPSTEGTQGSADRTHGSAGGRPPNPENVEGAAPSARDSDRLNGRPATAADRARRNRLRATATGPLAKAGVSPEELATGAVFERLPGR